MKLSFFILFFVAVQTCAAAEVPNCTGSERFLTSVAFVHLKNAGITNNQKVDFTKTKTVRLASEIIGKDKYGNDLHRQIHRVTFYEKNGEKISVITVNNASKTECSMSGVDVFVISKRLGKPASGNEP